MTVASLLKIHFFFPSALFSAVPQSVSPTSCFHVWQCFACAPFSCTSCPISITHILLLGGGKQQSVTSHLFFSRVYRVAGAIWNAVPIQVLCCGGLVIILADWRALDTAAIILKCMIRMYLFFDLNLTVWGMLQLLEPSTALAGAGVDGGGVAVREGIWDYLTSSWLHWCYSNKPAVCGKLPVRLFGCSRKVAHPPLAGQRCSSVISAAQLWRLKILHVIAQL